MALSELVFRDQLPPIVAEELDFQQSILTGFLYSEHHQDGSHSDITADSIVVTGPASAGVFASDRIQTPRDMDLGNPPTEPLLRVEDVDGTPMFDIGVYIEGLQSFENQSRLNFTVQTLLRLNGQSSYAPTADDETALFETASSPNYSYYRLVPAADRTIHGIYTADLVNGARGQVLCLVNDSAFTITFGTGVVSSARKILGTPFTLPPQAGVLIVYENASLGWRILASSVGSSADVVEWDDYTPVWTTTGTAPSLGNGTLTGRFQQVGNTVHFTLNFTAGSTTTFGTGDFRFSLPVATVGVSPVFLGFCNVADNAQQRGLWTKLITSTTFEMYDMTDNIVYALSPGAWADGDTLSINGTYEIA